MRRDMVKLAGPPGPGQPFSETVLWALLTILRADRLVDLVNLTRSARRPGGGDGVNGWRPTKDQDAIARKAVAHYRRKYGRPSGGRDLYVTALLGVWQGLARKPDAPPAYLFTCAMNEITNLGRHLDQGTRPRRPPGRPPKGEPAPERNIPYSPKCKGRSKPVAVAGRKREHLGWMLAGSGSSFHGSRRVRRSPLLRARLA